MSDNKVLVNSAHSPGQTCLAFSRDGSRAYTGGSDALVRVWDTSLGADQEPDVASEAMEGITAIASGNNCWLSGSMDSEVRRYEKSKSELDGLVTNASGVPIRSIAIDPKGKRVAVTSDETAVKLIDLEDTLKILILAGHKKSVRRATWHPSGTLLTISCSDGKIIAWDLSEEEPKITETIEGIIPAVSDPESPEFLHDCSVVWHTSGQYFFAASRAHEIITVSRLDWSKSSTFSDDSVSGAITALALSVNGVYLASASKSGVAIWSTQTRRLLFRHPGSPDAAIIQLAFSPRSNLLVWTDTDGVFSRWIEPIPASSPDPVKQSAGSTSSTVPVKRKGTPTLFGEDEPDVAARDKPNDDLMNLDDDWILDDLGVGLGEDNDEDKADKSGGYIKEMVSITKAQPSFQPGSTPMENKKQYLVYNMIGVIEVTDQDAHHIVNVEFHDRSARKSYHFTDYFKYDLASIGERGAAFACPPENDHPAQVLYKPYGTWASSNSDWTYTLPSSQRPVGVAAGGPPLTYDDAEGHGTVVVATSAGDLTFLAGTGSERRVLGLEGEFVSMVAGAEWVFVVYRAGSTTIDGSQNLVGTLICYEDFTVLQRGMLPIPKGQVLKWIGITEEGAPAIYDSSGHIHILAKFRVPLRATWARILDTNALERKQGKDESYWPIGVKEDTFSCLILKGRQEHPGFPRPLIQELPMRMPFRRTEGKEASLEEHFQRGVLFLDIERDALGDTLNTEDISQRELALDKELIQLIQIACKGDKLTRAVELASLLHHAKSFIGAIKIAEFYHLPGVQEKMEMLKSKREDDEDPLEKARSIRRGWKEDSDAVPSIYQHNGGGYGEEQFKPFQDYGPPKKIDRPGLQAAIPVVQRSRFSRTAQEDNQTETSFASPSDGKRKRDDDHYFGSMDSENEPKRIAVDEFDSQALPPPPKTKPVNPFSRKSGQEPNRNPFARKPEPNKTIQKSESFFDKVDAAECEKPKKHNNSKGKEKEKKDTSRQTTLFGLPAGPAPEKKARKKASAKTTSPETPADVDNPEITESQATDISMTDAAELPSDAATLVATQTLKVAADYTQSTADDSHTTTNDTQTTTYDSQNIDEAIAAEWPPSPPTQEATLVDEVGT